MGNRQDSNSKRQHSLDSKHDDSNGFVRYTDYVEDVDIMLDVFAQRMEKVKKNMVK